MSEYPDFILERDKPGSHHESWPMEPREYDPRYDVLRRCARCKRKVGTGPLKGLRLWMVRVVRPQPNPFGGPDPHGDLSWHLANIYCADEAECRAYLDSKEAKARAAQERRHPPAPHANAGRGRCQWCGERIEYVEAASPQRRRRTVHRGDEWELGDTNCLRLLNIWSNPKVAEQQLLREQDGKCAICEKPIAERRKHTREVWEMKKGKTPRRTGEIETWWRWDELPGDHGHIAVDHILPSIDGGLNLIENLQAICQRPCHAEKTKREARERAKRRRREAA